MCGKLFDEHGEDAEEGCTFVSSGKCCFDFGSRVLGTVCHFFKNFVRYFCVKRLGLRDFEISCWFAEFTYFSFWRVMKGFAFVSCMNVFVLSKRHQNNDFIFIFIFRMVCY